MSVQVCMCKTCGAPIAYSVEVAKWKCEYCESEFEKDEIQPKTTSDSGVETVEDLSVALPELDQYNCSNCGGQIICEVNTAADFCIYCKSPTIIKSRFTGDFQPRWVIPFKLTKHQAEQLYFKWIKKRFFAPTVLKQAAEVDAIRGLYAPYWLFDCGATGLIECDATNTRSYTSGSYRVTETKHYSVKRSGAARYQRIPVDGSKMLDDSLMEGIEPFNYSEIKDFAVAYMSGFLAERYDVPSDEAAKAMEPRVGSFLKSCLHETISGYSSVKERSGKVSVNEVKAAYAMLPVFILTNIYKGKKYSFLVNGQTGKIYGETPVDQGRRMGFAALFFAVSWVICVLLGGLANAT